MKSVMQAKNACLATDSGRPVWSVKLHGVRRRDVLRPAAVLSRFQAEASVAASTQAVPQAAERGDVTARPRDVVVEVGEVPRVPNALVAARSLFAALNSRDVSAVLTLLEENVWYENLGCSTPLRGRAAVGRFYLEALADLPDDAVFVLEGPGGPEGGDPWDVGVEGPSGPVLQAGVAWHLEVNGVVVPLSHGVGVYWAHPRSGRLVRIRDNPEHTVKQSAPSLSNAAWASSLLRGLGPLVMPAAQGVTSFLNTTGAPPAGDGGSTPDGASASAVGLAAGMLSSLSGMLPFQPSAPAPAAGGNRNGAAGAATAGGGGRALYRDHTRLSAPTTTAANSTATTSGSSTTRNDSSSSSGSSSRNGLSKAAAKAVEVISVAAAVRTGNEGGAPTGTTVGGAASGPATRGSDSRSASIPTAAAAAVTFASSEVARSLSDARSPSSTLPSAGSSLAASSNENGNDNRHANDNGHLNGNGPGAAAEIAASSRSGLATPSTVVDRTSSASSGTGITSTSTPAASAVTAATTVTTTTANTTTPASTAPRASPALARPSAAPAAVSAASSAASTAPQSDAASPAAAASSSPAAPAVAVVSAITITRAGTSATANDAPASNNSSAITAGSSSTGSRSSNRAAEAVLRQSQLDAGTSAPPSSTHAPSTPSASEAQVIPAASSSASVDDDVPGPNSSSAPGSGTPPTHLVPAATKGAETIAPMKVSIGDTTNSFTSLENTEKEPGAGHGALPFAPSTSFSVNLSGLWEKDSAASQSQEYESMLDVLELGGLQKVTARLIDGLDVRQDEGRFEVGFVTIVPFFRVSEKSRFGAPTTMMRRDLRSGRQTALACRIPGGVQVDMSWEAPLAGTLREEYVTSADGHMLAVTSTIRVGQQAATATQVYRRSSRNKVDFLASQRSSYGSMEDVLKSQEKTYGKIKY